MAALFPDPAAVELIVLQALRDTGWRFRPILDDGVLAGIDGFRPRELGFTDGIRVRSAAETTVIRTDAGHAPVWRYTGRLLDAVAELHALPAPGERFAPRLIVVHDGLRDC